MHLFRVVTPVDWGAVQTSVVTQVAAAFFLTAGVGGFYCGLPAYSAPLVREVARKHPLGNAAVSRGRHLWGCTDR